MAAYLGHTEKSTKKLREAAETIRSQNISLEQANRLLKERSTAAMESLSATVDARDAYTAGHSRRVQQLALAIGRELGLSQAELDLLGQAALFHDIGKLAIPDAVLLKPATLSTDEWWLMQRHAGGGRSIIDRLGFLDDAVPAIRHHHERWDGAGYPDGLAGEEIPLGARIIHVADALDSMLTNRIYRAARPAAEALDELRRGGGSQFCPRCVSASNACSRATRAGSRPRSHRSQPRHKSLQGSEPARLHWSARPRVPRYSDARILEELNACADRLGRSPTMREFAADPDAPLHPQTVVERFGTWNAAKRRAGLVPRRFATDPSSWPSSRRSAPSSAGSPQGATSTSGARGFRRSPCTGTVSARSRTHCALPASRFPAGVNVGNGRCSRGHAWPADWAGSLPSRLAPSQSDQFRASFRMAGLPALCAGRTRLGSVHGRGGRTAGQGKEDGA